MLIFPLDVRASVSPTEDTGIISGKTPDGRHFVMRGKAIRAMIQKADTDDEKAFGEDPSYFEMLSALATQYAREHPQDVKLVP